MGKARRSRRAGSITLTAVAEVGDGIPPDGCARGPGPLAGATLPPLLRRADRGDRRRRVARHAHRVRLPLVLPARALEGRARGRRAAVGRRACADGVRAPRVLRRSLPALRPHPVLGKWLYLAAGVESFEDDARAIAAMALADDPRLGVEPRPQRRRGTAGRARGRLSALCATPEEAKRTRAFLRGLCAEKNRP